MHSGQKITVRHLERPACIYIRQSTARQVRQNQESQVNQYQLIERAEGLGWPRERIRVIDSDLGLSGQSSAGRAGFQELVAEVSLGHVGIIFGYEVSRLARNNSDWYHLLDLAAVFGTLIADTDGIYDPRLYNDRLLLGLKGTMSEAELHLLRLRLREGVLRRVERGEHPQNLPTGLVRLADGAVVKDPDDQVRHAIELVLVKFAELGSCRQVLLYLRDAGILLPRRQTMGPALGQIIWKRPAHHAIYHIVTNPAYAGAFAYGRRQLDPAKRKPGRRDTGIVNKVMGEWGHLQLEVYPAYIPWQQYLANQERLHQNATPFKPHAESAQGPARGGQALLQGLAICGLCGRHMQAVYKPAPRYICTEEYRKLGDRMCCSLYAPAIDEAVVEAFFAAVQPAQLDALQALLADQEAEQARLVQQWDERLKRARYEAQLAERQYNAVDPDNRLVAAELERRWEAKLRQVQEVQDAYDRFRQTHLPRSIPAELCEQFRHIAAALPGLWRSGQLANDQKKELLRSLISQVVLTRAARNTIEAKIVWVSGHYSIVSAQPPIYRFSDAADYPSLVERIHQLWQQGLSDPEIAAQLSTEGFRAAREKILIPSTIQRIRLDHGWQRIDYHYSMFLDVEGYLSVTALAMRLRVERSWVLRRIRNHTIAARYLIRHPKYSQVYLIQDAPELLDLLSQQLPPPQDVNRGI
jgi:DNA invertase Pin-like site-specific DNA recombinase